MEVPSSTNDILLLPGILVFFGAFVYGVAFANGLRDHVFPKYRWVGVLLLGIATAIGIRYVLRMVGSDAPFYRSMITSKKVEFAHYIALVMPLVALAIVLGMEMWFKNYRRNME